jgi:hypothetical protein
MIEKRYVVNKEMYMFTFHFLDVEKKRKTAASPHL